MIIDIARRCLSQSITTQRSEWASLQVDELLDECYIGQTTSQYVPKMFRQAGRKSQLKGHPQKSSKGGRSSSYVFLRLSVDGFIFQEQHHCKMYDGDTESRMEC